MLYIAPARLTIPGNPLADGALLVKEGKIAAFGPAKELPPPAGVRRMDAGGLALAPGFIDLQLNGGFGWDFTEQPDSLWQVAARLPQYGVTSFLPTVVTSPLEWVERALAVLRLGPPASFKGAAPLGYHLEGPFLNPARKGAHNPAHIRAPSTKEVKDWSLENGVRLVTLAPEQPGALELVRLLRERGVVVSAGHSMATLEQAQAGFAAGIAYGTHLFNAMPPLDHRAPGLVGALLSEPGVTVGLIADGIHVHPRMAALTWRLKGPQRLSLVTDAIAALGMPPGRYPLAGYEVIVDETSARLPEGSLAGSLLTLDAAVRNLMAFSGCSLEEALATVTTTSADLLGLAHKGRLEVGADADLVLLTPEGEVVATFVGGEMVYSRVGMGD